MSTTTISFSAVSKTFSGNNRPALDGVSLDIRRNEFFTLLGPSGCGKTTLLRMIAGFETPDRGDVLLEGASLLGIPPHRRPVNTVFQSYALFPHMSVAQNIAFGLDMLGWRKSDIEARVARVIALVKLDGLADRRPSQLSGGQQQRVALARALAPEPKVLLLDEPLSALDLKLRKEMQIELKRLQMETGITFLFVTHDQEEALTMSDRIAVMRDGGIAQVDTPKVIYEHPADRFVAGFIGEANFWSATCVFRDGKSGRFQLYDSRSVLEAQDANGMAIGQEALLVVRPERLVIDETGPLEAEIGHVAYRGSDVLFDMRLEGGTLVRARVPAAEGAAAHAGQRLRFAIPGSAIRVFSA